MVKVAVGEPGVGVRVDVGVAVGEPGVLVRVGVRERVMVGLKVGVYVGPNTQAANCAPVVPKTPVMPALVGAT